MKHVFYRIRGQVDSTMVPAIMASVAAVAGVHKVILLIRDEESLDLNLVLADDPTPAQEASFASIMTAKGLELLPDTLIVVDQDAPGEPVSAEPVWEPNHYVTSPPPREPRKISLTAAVAAMVTAVVLAVFLTFALTTAYQKSATPPTADQGQGTVEKTVFDELEILDRLFRSIGVTELGEDFPAALLKAYVAATGDLYAEYFTAEELEALAGEQNGEMCGIGITVVNGICTVGGIDYQAIVVTNVYKDSPASAAGVLPGDYILYVGTGEDAVSVHEIGYTEALDRMAGEEGTTCSFTAFRLNAETGLYDEIEISAARRKLTMRSVNGRVYTLDSTVGIIRITGFDNTTREQFIETVEALKAEGCTSFVLDLRGNPGGLLTSVEDMLTLFLREGDTMISTKDSAGNETVTRLAVGTDGKVTVGSRTLTAADVGKYRDLEFSVLVNGYSASAAELFTANMRDYELAEIVGMKTYGKGSMQSTVNLARYGYEGALKLTTAYYYPPSGVGYHEIGITPDITVDLSDEAKKININLLTDEQDNQLAEAVRTAKPAA